MSSERQQTHILFVTTCRSDYGPVSWLLRQIVSESRIRLSLVVGGAHCSERHGRTIDEIERDGLSIARTLDWLGGDLVDAFGASSGRALTMFDAALRELQPDAVVVYGDRHELLPLTAACVLERVPIVHLCGGDVTEGALDDQVRHAVTKLAHVHLTTSELSAARIRQMGEEPWRVRVVGDPSLDVLRHAPRASLDELERDLGWRPDRRTLLVTLHPTTLDPDAQPAELATLADALKRHDGGLVITAPAPDPGFLEIAERWRTLVAGRPRAAYVESLGSYRYRGLLFAVGAMVGNSSSGLTESPCAGLPAINIGHRQSGRTRGDNVIDVASGDAASLEAALAFALSPDGGERLRQGRCTSPYGDGHASPRILELLTSLPPREALLAKRFVPAGAIDDA